MKEESGIRERFELLALAGSGGMGEVYRARDRATGRVVALKVLRAGVEEEERFEREATLLSTLEHEGIVRYLDHGVARDGARFLVMEWLEGKDLDSTLGYGWMGVPAALSVGVSVARALGAAHRVGVVHRDVKPANVFLVGGRPEQAKLVDFGLAKRTSDRGLTEPGALLGTPAYMAPEHVRGGQSDKRSDVYGLGAVLFRCLTGRAPFSGEHRIAVLAKVVLEGAPRLREVRPEVSEELDELVARLLAKEPGERPEDGEAALSELVAIGRAATPQQAAVTARERRVASVVLCAGGNEETLTSAQEERQEAQMREAIEARGGVLDALARGAWLVTVRRAASLREQASQAARCALALSAQRPAAPVAVATGKVVVAGGIQVGEVIDRAAQAVARAQGELRPGVSIDEATAELLDERFEVRGAGAWRELLGEHDAIAPVRTLLGRPSACVGRAQELGALGAALSACIDEESARVVLVTGPPGMGKTRLVHEFARATLAARGDVDVLLGRGDVLRAGSALGLLGGLLRRAALSLDPGQTDARAALRRFVERDLRGADAERVDTFLAELCGLGGDETSAPLRAARADPGVMADAVRRAWLDWLGARLGRGPVLLLVEDLHWADGASVRLLEAALGAHAERPLMVLATARPDPALAEPWRRRGLQELHLAPLPSRAAQRLAKEALGPDADEATVRALVERSEGHPFHLEELIRAVASGQGPEALPDSVLGMVQARLDELAPEARRVLRAASVFGETFWAGGVEALLGTDEAVARTRAHLGRLAEQEIIARQPSSRRSGEVEYTFRHALVRDAAYAALTEADRIEAHRRAGSWLEEQGEGDAAVLAEHFERGGSPAHALGFFRRAASQALEGNDLERALSFVSRALDSGPTSDERAALWALEAEVRYWRGEHEQAAARAAQAAGSLPEGSPPWLDAVAVALGALGQRGHNDGVASWLERAALAEVQPEARGAHLVALCRGLTQLLWAHHPGDLRPVQARLDALAGDPASLDPFEAGWLHRVRGESAWLHDRDIDRCLRELAASCAAFARAGALRNLCLTRVNAATLAGWAGRLDQSFEMLARSRSEADRIGPGFLSLYLLAVQGLLSAYAGSAEAEATMRRALAGLAQSPRLAFLCRIVVGWQALDRGDPAEAQAQATAASALPVVAELRPAAFALLALASLAQNQPERALDEARRAVALLDDARDLELTEGMAHLALAQAHLALGDLPSARDAASAGHQRLSFVASAIASPDDRQRFWSRPLPNAQLDALARRLGVVSDVVG